MLTVKLKILSYFVLFVLISCSSDKASEALLDVCNKNQIDPSECSRESVGHVCDKNLLLSSKIYKSCLLGSVKKQLSSCDQEYENYRKSFYNCYIEPKKPTLVETEHLLDVVGYFKNKVHDKNQKDNQFLNEFIVMENSFDEDLKLSFFDHRLNEVRQRWKSFKYNDYQIIFGSVARSDNDIHSFVWVGKTSPEKTDTIYLGVGSQLKIGQFPDKIQF